MYAVMIAGSGKIGALIGCLLSMSGDYEVHFVDLGFDSGDIQRLKKQFPELKTAIIDVRDAQKMGEYIKSHRISALISCLPYFLNVGLATIAKEQSVHYFDLTEDTQVTSAVKTLAQNCQTAFVPQCGLAPGFISIAAHSLMQDFDTVDTVKLRVGALPRYASNQLHYALTWSTDGLINEYGNPCHAIENGQSVLLHPLQNREEIIIDGERYEAFNTSGGLGSLADLCQSKVRNMNYKTIRYPGHCEKIRFLMYDLRLNEDRDTLKRVFEHAIPKTYQDVVVIYVSVSGHRDKQFVEEAYVKKVLPQTIHDLDWSAIQVTTASGMCAVVDLVLSQPGRFKGLVFQEQFHLNEFLKNRFGRYYA